ncbi:hypothetical protein T484DRAFT_1865641 [Baffinella frigidus]|nr:hypothetical protein T484DRAFT_1865641 [Cryptophyta sp. CCMP2293]
MVTYGFVGIGIMGRGMVLNLLKAGNKVVVWNRSADKCADVVATPGDVVKAADVTFAMLADPEEDDYVFRLRARPGDVVKAADVTFAMLADPEIALDIAFRADGIIAAISAGKIPMGGA